MSQISSGARMEALAAAAPYAPAVVHAGRVLSRGSSRAAPGGRRVFAQRGVVEGDRVVIALSNGLEWFRSCLAAWKLGAVATPRSPIAFHPTSGPSPRAGAPGDRRCSWRPRR